MDVTKHRLIADTVLACGLLLISGLAYWGTLELPDPIFDPLGAAFVPKVLAYCLAFASVILLIKTFYGAVKFSGAKQNQAAGTSEEAVSGQEQPRQRNWLAFASVLLTIAYIAVMYCQLCGYRTATIIFLIAFGTMLAGLKPKMIAINLVIALILGFGLYWIFTEVLVVNLP
ncbi:MAG: tripartite tricarboxylate transporter TctB family protein [Deltaproteobacteria bacterium]|nr:tripartite tricarboxylate transporter TctB family protein [Deltaproteobacteria bacterium]